ncbi:Spore germination protein B1 [bioreactor metagenome]|uniref:Spore germination protein B1 n=1 Tax=bioreactor metagenome TaxID=1076179 RepID=A0A644X441_9ZZZZ
MTELFKTIWYTKKRFVGKKGIFLFALLKRLKKILWNSVKDSKNDNRKNNKEKQNEEEPAAERNASPEESDLTGNFEKDVETVEELFHNNDTLVVRKMENRNGKTIKFCIMYIDGMVNSLMINQNVVFPIENAEIGPQENALDHIFNQVILISEIEKTAKVEKILEAIVSGDTVLFVENSDNVLLLNTKGFTHRSVTEPESEKILRGPREGFTEVLLENLSMLRRRIGTQDLKMKFKILGKRTKTKACVCYIEGLVNPKILDELYRRLDKLNMDGTLDVNYISEIIKDSPLTTFKTIGDTERPDVVAARLLEGRVAVLLNGTPVAITVPYLFIENFQNNEDYYVNFYYASIQRLVRMAGFLITVYFPAFYVAVMTYHQEILPTPMLVSVSTARESVPFPTVIEVFIMIFVFMVISETGVRMPVGIGHALSIVGALVIGQAAVDAKLISAPVIIIVALTGITGLMVQKLNASIIVYRTLILLLASFTGIVGIAFGTGFLIIHLFNIRSFGVPYISELSFRFQKNKDIFMRAPWWKMITRPDFAMDKVRMNTEKSDR